MALIGLLANIVIGATNIGEGRKNLATAGFERAGRISYEKGILTALAAFKEAQITAEPTPLVFLRTFDF